LALSHSLKLRNLLTPDYRFLIATLLTPNFSKFRKIKEIKIALKQIKGKSEKMGEIDLID